MPTPAYSAPMSPQRRGLLLGGGAAVLLAACGGGGDGAAPAIHEFSADRSSYFVGEQATIEVRFSGASARLEPGIGRVVSGQAVTTPPLDQSRRFVLTVETPGQPTVSRELGLDVRFRDRWVGVAAFVVSGHATAPAADGSLLVIGGSRGGTTLSEAVDRFDPATRRFQRIGGMAAGRSEHTALALGDGRVLVLGGASSSVNAPFAELIDSRSGAVTFAGRLARGLHGGETAVLLQDGRVLLSGGVDRNSAEIWEPATATWRLLPARMAHERQFHSATLLADGRVLLAGGHANVPDGYVFAELFDPGTETFTPLNTAITERRCLHAAHRLVDGSVLLLGGEWLSGGSQWLASVLRFDPAIGSFRTEAALEQARTVAASVWLPADQVLLAGGQTDADVRATASAAVWRGAQPTRALAPMPAARVWHTVDRLADGRLLVLGGEDGAGNFLGNALIYE